MFFRVELIGSALINFLSEIVVVVLEIDFLDIFINWMFRGLANLLSSITVLFISCLSSLFISSSSPLNFLSFSFFSFFLVFLILLFLLLLVFLVLDFVLLLFYLFQAFFGFLAPLNFLVFLFLLLLFLTFFLLFLAIATAISCYILINCTGFIHLSVMIGNLNLKEINRNEENKKMKIVIMKRKGYQKELKEIREENEVVKRELTEKGNDMRREMIDRVIE